MNEPHRARRNGLIRRVRRFWVTGAGGLLVGSALAQSAAAPATTHYTPPDDGMWSRQMKIDITRTPGADKDHFVVQFTVPDASARFVSPADKALQFNLVKIYGNRMQSGSRTDIPNGVLPWPTGEWKPGDRVRLEFDLPKQFASAADGGNLRFCVGTDARCLPSPNLLLDAATTPATLRPEMGFTDTFAGTSRGAEHGITFISLPFGGGAVFSRDNDSRIEYRILPREGTLEWWVLIRGGYHYADYKLHADDPCAMLFSSDVSGGDVTWPGATRLTLCRNGDITLDIAEKKYDAPHQTLRAKSTAFRFDEWHSVGISFGSSGQVIELDGAPMTQDPSHRQTLGAAGTHDAPVDIPTIGQTASGYWPPHRYDGGFEGIVARFRASSNQRDWVLAKTPPPAELSVATNAGSSHSDEKDRSQSVSLVDENGITVSSVDTPSNLELTVRSPEPVFVSVEVDRDQDGQIDRLVDVAYRPQRDGTLCTEYLIDETHSSACGQFVSGAYLKDEKTEDGRTQYTLVLPKEELSFNRLSAKLSFVMWNSAQRQTTYNPAGRFQNALTVSWREPRGIDKPDGDISNPILKVTPAQQTEQENPVTQAPVGTPVNPPKEVGDVLDQRLRELAGNDAEDCGTVPIRGDPSVARACAEKVISEKKPFFVRFRIMSIDSNVSLAFAGSPDGKVFQIGFSDRRLAERACPAPVQLWGTENEIPDCFLADMAAACKGKNASASVPPATLVGINRAVKATEFEEVIRIANEPNSGLRVMWIRRGKTGRILSYGIANQEGCTVSQMQMYDVE